MLHSGALLKVKDRSHSEFAAITLICCKVEEEYNVKYGMKFKYIHLLNIVRTYNIVKALKV